MQKDAATPNTGRHSKFGGHFRILENVRHEKADDSTNSFNRLGRSMVFAECRTSGLASGAYDFAFLAGFTLSSFSLAAMSAPWEVSFFTGSKMCAILPSSPITNVTRLDIPDRLRMPYDVATFLSVSLSSG